MTRTLIGYRVRRGKVRGKGGYLGTDHQWTAAPEEDSLYTTTMYSWALTDAKMHGGRVVIVYSRSITRADIEQQTAKRISEWLLGNAPWGHHLGSLRTRIERGDWRTK